METKLRLLLVSGRLPEPAVQFPITAGGRVIARADLCYPDSRLCIEYDGAVHRDTLIVDNQRQNRILEAGYTILRFTAPDLSNPHEVVRQVRAALKRAA